MGSDCRIIIAPAKVLGDPGASQLNRWGRSYRQICCSHVRFFYVAGLVVFFTVLASAQVTNSKKFNPVSRPLRDRLIARLNLYVEYERTRQYEKLWNLLSQEYIENQQLTREDYLGHRTNDTLLEFKPIAVIKSPTRWLMRDGMKTEISISNVFEIHGVAKFRRGNKIGTENRLLEARLEGDDWYFSDWLVQVE